MSYISINPKNNIDQFLRLRPQNSYPKNINDEIKMLTFSRKAGDARIFGSFSYIIQKYAADIDLTENYYLKDTPENVIIKFKNSLKTIVRNIIKKRSHWFSEYKTGYDEKYNVNIGFLSEGFYKINEDLEEIVNEMFKSKLFNVKEKKLLIKCIEENRIDPNNTDVYDVIYNIFRERKILRWTSKEILSEIKNLPGGRHITLLDALHMKGHVKIDEIVHLNGKFIEITNFVFLGYTDAEGKDWPINIDIKTYKILVEQLKKEIEKLILSNFYYSPFKAVKRMFAMSRYIYNIKKDNIYKNDLEHLIPFVSSDISFLYQMKSELEAVQRVFQVAKTIPKVSIDNQIQNIKLGLSNILELSNNTIINFNVIIDKILRTKLKKNKYQLIGTLIKKMKNIINGFTINYFDKIGFNPPPFEFLLNNLEYKYIERKSDDIPQNNELIQEYKKL